MKKYFLSLFLLLAFLLNISEPAVQAAVLTDLQNHWSAGDVQQLIDRGSVGGYPDGTFHPDATITRAEFSKILRQSLELSSVEGNDFSDTVNHWAVTDIHTLVAQQIIVPAEYGNHYAPDSAITRREIAIMLVRALNLNDSATDLAGQPTGFSDDNKMASYDKGYLYLAKELGLVGGYDDGSFQPGNKATRAEASVMIVRLLNLKEQIGTIPQTPQGKPNDSNEQAPQQSSGSDRQTINQVQYQLSLLETSRSSRNSLGEQYCLATLQLTIHNQSGQAITISNDNLQVVVTYNNNAQVTAIQPDFQQTVAAEQTAMIHTTVQILLPDNAVANLVLGNQISDINVQLNTAHQIVTFTTVDAALLQAVQ